MTQTVWATEPKILSDPLPKKLVARVENTSPSVGVIPVVCLGKMRLRKVESPRTQPVSDRRTT